MAHKVKLVTPHAAVIVWNYADRISAHGAENPDEIERVIINTTDLISISTSKRKSNPAGSFEFRLAPTNNWVSTITPGSWCVLLMSQSKPIPTITPDNLGTADPELVKMLGRIDSVRLVVGVNPETGARMTQYVITGQDWCSVFDTKLYIDPIVRNNNFDKLTAIGHAARLTFDNFILEWSDDKHPTLPTSSQVISAMIDLWGAPITDISSSVSSALLSGANPIQLDNNIIFSSEAQFKLPTSVAQYMGLGGLLGGVTGGSVNFSKIIARYDGILTGYDTYSGDNEESNGFPDPSSMYKVNTFWQILTDNSNPLINELVTDIRWEDGKANLALYKRIKPFINRSAFDGSDQPEVKKNLSKFSNIRRVVIPLEDVIDINAGTNWRDKFNFIEIRPQPQLNVLNFDSTVKLDSQIVDRKAYEREGFKPLIQTAYYMPFSGGEPAPLAALQWKYLMKEWYFNTHLMLNGSVNIVGQNTYIQVGDNIMIDASVLGPNNMNSLQDGPGFLLAHVEAINHTFTDVGNGTRSFVTNIQFVRGVITREDGTIFGSAGSGISGIGAFNLPMLSIDGDPMDAAIDRNAKDMKQSSNPRTIKSSSTNDPLKK